MRIDGYISPGNEAWFDRQIWCGLISRRPEFGPAVPREMINPFTKEHIMLQTSGDMADVWLEGRIIGSTAWAPEIASIHFCIEPSGLPLLHVWAVDLGGKIWTL